MTPAYAAPRHRWVIDFLLLSAAWGGSFLFMRVATQEFGALPTAALRTGVAALMLLPLLLLRGLGSGLRQHWRPLLVVGMVNSAIPFACYSFALLSITSGLSAILNATTPLFGALVAWVWLGDRPGRWRTLGLAVGFAGVVMLAWNKASFRPDASGLATGWAVLACLLATLCYGIAASYTRRHVKGLQPVLTAAGSQIGATVGLLLPALWFMPRQWPSVHAWMAVLAAGTLSTGVAYLLFFRLLEQAGPTRALAVTFVVPVFAVVFGAIFLGEAITPWMVVCGAIILAGTGLATGLIRPRGRTPTGGS
ncbi:MAG: DMT family transporter [Burkholderiaceae bacterium]|nr:DMT family transporter [Burkholderiaceae bacterium]